MPTKGIWVEQVDKRTRNGKKCVDSTGEKSNLQSVCDSKFGMGKVEVV